MKTNDYQKCVRNTKDVEFMVKIAEIIFSHQIHTIAKETAPEEAIRLLQKEIETPISFSFNEEDTETLDFLYFPGFSHVRKSFTASVIPTSTLSPVGPSVSSPLPPAPVISPPIDPSVTVYLSEPTNLNASKKKKFFF